MDHIQLDERRLAEAYLAGLVRPEERAAFEVHVVGCEECRDRVLLAEMFRTRAPRLTQDAAPSQATGTPSNGGRLPADPYPRSTVQAGDHLSGGGSRPSPHIPHPLYYDPEPWRAEAARLRVPVRPLPRRHAPSAEEVIAYHPVARPTPSRRSGRRLVLAMSVLFAAVVGYFAGAATPALHGSGTEAIPVYSVTAPARTREEAILQIVEQSNVVLGGEKITLALIRSTLPGYDHISRVEHQGHAKRLRSYYDIFRKEYLGLLLLYKTNESVLQKGDILFLEDAMVGAQDVERNMRQLDSLNLH